MVSGGRSLVTLDNGSVLVLRRRSDGKLVLPGGVVEEGESLHDCAVRELQEETGLQAVEWRAFAFASGQATEVSVYPNGDVVHCHSLLIHVSHWVGRPQNLDEDASELLWVDAQERRDEIRGCDARALVAFRKFVATGEFQVY